MPSGDPIAMRIGMLGAAVRRGLCSQSLVAAVEERSVSRLRRVMYGAGATALAAWAYDFTARWYAQILLRSAATEQLYMQRLQGTVELEMRLQPFSRVGELRGLLTPVAEAPRTSGPIRHRAFTLLEPADPASKGVSSITRARHQAAADAQLPPVATTRQVPCMAPINPIALFAAEPPETRLYCRKSRTGTEFFTKPPPNWVGWGLPQGA